jgi:hypothetical protein
MTIRDRGFWLYMMFLALTITSALSCGVNLSSWIRRVQYQPAVAKGRAILLD